MAFQTSKYRKEVSTSLHSNGLEFDDDDMLDSFVDKLSVEMDSIGIDDNFVREEYEKWLHHNQKQECEVRYKQFKKNFLLQLEYDDSNGGRFHGLNQYGDFSSDEFYEHLKQ
ncbi:unnamed protein product [Cylindrotheca closterium]|uniref:Cathepsin propeptide inhibitor domain-containing protein n=1 Tax=Cylindrotheca closterium TaxID=2856 RepID=A0AAD2FZE3_9STRA|nr:unnamed protein product [Cylindrotheca closterium]